VHVLFHAISNSALQVYYNRSCVTLVQTSCFLQYTCLCVCVNTQIVFVLTSCFFQYTCVRVCDEIMFAFTKRCYMTHEHVTWPINVRHDSWICNMAHACTNICASNFEEMRAREKKSTRQRASMLVCMRVCIFFIHSQDEEGLNMSRFVIRMCIVVALMWRHWAKRAKNSYAYAVTAVISLWQSSVRNILHDLRRIQAWKLTYVFDRADTPSTNTQQDSRHSGCQGDYRYEYLFCLFVCESCA